MAPNIIFVLLDGSRHDRLHISEKFSDLCKEGFLLNNVTAAYPYTFSAMNAIFTGLFGKENGVDAYYKMFKLRESIPFLPDILQKNGFFTACNLISDKVISSRGFHIHTSHDEYVDDLTQKHPELLKKWFSEAGDRPLFAFLQFSRIHTVTVSEVLKKYDWDNQEYYDNKTTNLENYDTVFLEAVEYASIIKKTVEDLGKFENTILVFFADHGTGVGERFGERNYGVFTYEETIRTFYLFIGPNIQKNKKCDKLLTSIELFPTLLQLGGVISGMGTKPRSFANYLLGKDDSFDDDEYCFSETGGLQGPFPSPKSPNVFSIKTTTHKLIYFKSTEKFELYNLVNDPKEQNNIFGSIPEIESKLKTKLLDWINR